MSFAKQAGLAPPDATKASHGAVRDACKALVLGIGYGMGEDGLAVRMGQPKIVARDLLRLHKATYPRFWRWSQANGAEMLPLACCYATEAGLSACCPELDPIGGTTRPAVLLGRWAGSAFLDHATQGVCCCCCRCGHVGDARASSKRSIMSTALSASAPVMPSRQTAIGVRSPSA